MKNIKCLVVLVCMTFGLVNVAKAQVQNSEVVFFEHGSARNDDDKTIAVLRFQDGKLYCHPNWVKGYVKSKLRNSKFYFDNFPKGMENDAWIYYFNKSKAEYYVYESERTFNKTNVNPRSCIAVSKDLSSLVTFSVDADGNAYNKWYYIKISKEDILPKALNNDEFDFLND